MLFQTEIGTDAELQTTALLFGIGIHGTARIAKFFGIKTTGTAGIVNIFRTAGTTKTAKIAGIGTAGIAIEKSWNHPC